MASMNALVKELVLLGGWLAFAAFGYYAVSQLGDFLEQCQAEGEAAYDLPEEQGDLNIAAASPWAMQAGSQVLKAMQREHPYLHCTLSMGEEPELLDALGTGDVDIVILYSKAAQHKGVRQRKITLPARPFVNEDGVKITPIHSATQSQFVAWNNRDRRPVILEFVEKLCGQGA